MNSIHELITLLGRVAAVSLKIMWVIFCLILLTYVYFNIDADGSFMVGAGKLFGTLTILWMIQLPFTWNDK